MIQYLRFIRHLTPSIWSASTSFSSIAGVSVLAIGGLMFNIGSATAQTQAAASEKPIAAPEMPKVQTPDEVINSVTEKLMDSIGKGKKTLQSNPEAYYQQVESYLEDAVDFSFIARQVMGKHRKAASPEQVTNFEKIFKRSLVETYVKGMSTFADLKMTIRPPSSPYPDYGKATVVQTIKTPSGENNVAYVMGRVKDKGSWKIINVVLNGANLGKIFRSQFDQSVKDKGSVAGAIKAWNFTAPD